MYQFAVKGLTDALEAIGRQFGPSGADESHNDSSAAGAPELFEEAVCCMEGMDCWTGAYANTQGRAGLEAELAWLQEELPYL
jgi:hypothetical protein